MVLIIIPEKYQNKPKKEKGDGQQEGFLASR